MSLLLEGAALILAAFIAYQLALAAAALGFFGVRFADVASGRFWPIVFERIAGTLRAEAVRGLALLAEADPDDWHVRILKQRFASVRDATVFSEWGEGERTHSSLYTVHIPTGLDCASGFRNNPDAFADWKRFIARWNALGEEQARLEVALRFASRFSPSLGYDHW